MLIYSSIFTLAMIAARPQDSHIDSINRSIASEKYRMDLLLKRKLISENERNQKLADHRRELLILEARKLRWYQSVLNVKLTATEENQLKLAIQNKLIPDPSRTTSDFRNTPEYKEYEQLGEKIILFSKTKELGKLTVEEIAEFDAMKLRYNQLKKMLDNVK